MLEVLSQAQIEEFIEHGATTLRGGFAPAVADRGRDRIWQELGLSAQEPAARTPPVVHMQRCFDDGPFAEVMNPRLTGAFDQLLGRGRYWSPTSFGWWPVAFPGFDTPPWRPPLHGWHVDGQHFHHHLDGPEQGLLPLFIFSEIQPGDGGTAYRVGSHRITARLLAQAVPAGLGPQEVSDRAAAASSDLPAEEAVGQPGDVLLLHPFLVHARSPNTGSRVRVICNPCISLRERIRLGGPADATPLERSISRAIAAPAP